MVGVLWVGRIWKSLLCVEPQLDVATPDFVCLVDVFLVDGFVEVFLSVALPPFVEAALCLCFGPSVASGKVKGILDKSMGTGL